jgi:hypothetical protein
MRHNRNSFYRELTPLANKLRDMASKAPAPLSVAKNYNECMAKQSAKLARRAARAGHKPSFDRDKTA